MELSTDLNIDIPEIVEQLQQNMENSSDNLKIEQEKGDFIVKSGYKVLRIKPSY